VHQLSLNRLWEATLAGVRADFWTLFAIAAPFVLLVQVALALLGPEPPKDLAGFTPKVLVLLFILPSFIGTIGQLAVIDLIARPQRLPRQALGAALAMAPAYLLASLLGSMFAGFGLVLLIIPGLYILARLYVTAPVAMLEGLGPLPMLQRSWALTEGHGGTIFLFMLTTTLGYLGLSFLAAAIGSAIGSVLTLLNLAGIAHFTAALVPSLVGNAIAVVAGSAAVAVYQAIVPDDRLAEDFR
jgi:hypothetical protein